MSFLDLVEKNKIIPVVAFDEPEQAVKLGEILKNCDLLVAEVVLRTDSAIDALRLMKNAHPEISVIAGTVKNAAEVVAAHEAGADIIVSPGLNPNTVRKCQELGIEVVPGVNNPSDVERALELGISTLKFFPAEASGGISMIKSLLAPYRGIKFMPTGGIKPTNVQEYLAIDGVVCCGGTWFIDKEKMNNGEWHLVERDIRDAIASL